MSAPKRVTACLIIIGNEILSGRTEDQNTPYLAKKLNDCGIGLREIRVVPDVEEEIVDVPVTVPKLIDVALGDGRDELVDESLAGEVDELRLRPGLQHRMRRSRSSSRATARRRRSPRSRSGSCRASSG